MYKPAARRKYRIRLFAVTVFALITLQFSAVSAQSIWEGGNIENGQSLFNANCASCHKVTDEVLAAPGLAGIADRWGASDELLVKWIQNPQEAAESGDAYIKSIVDRYVGTYGWMTAQAVSADDVKDIMTYVANPPNVEVTVDTSDACPTIDESASEDGDSSSMLWFVLLLVLFTIIALSASGVRRSLSDIISEKGGKENGIHAQ